MSSGPAHAALSGTELVEASAGTGKTHTITTLFLRLVLERGLGVPEIVVVTFTEAATSELRGRVRRRLREALAAIDDPSRPVDSDLRAILDGVGDQIEGRRRIVAALSELDLASISTIHAFCLRALQERAFESGASFGLELASDTSELTREIADDYWSAVMVPMAPDLHRLVRQTLTLDVTYDLVRAVGRYAPDVPILPGIEPPDPESRRPALGAAYKAARATWRSQSKRVRAMLIASSDLSKAERDGYHEDNVAAWADELDELLAPEMPFFCNADALWRFTKSAIAGRTLSNRKPPTHKFFDQAEVLFALASVVEDELSLRFKLGLISYARRELGVRKDAQRIRGFEDLLFALERALAGDSGPALSAALRGQYRAALIDEFQDTDPVQFRIFRRIFHGHTNLILVGDPKQSIYAFRGADVFSYFQAARDAGASTYSLDTNHRSDPSLVRAVNTIFQQVPKPFIFDEIAFRPVTAHAPRDRINGEGSAFEVLFLPRPSGQTKAHTKGTLRKTLPQLVATEVARFLASGARIEREPARAGHIAILTRTNAQALEVQDALRRLGIPTALESEASVLDSLEAGELEHVLRAILAPTRGSALRTALATSIVGVSAEQIVALEVKEQGWQEWSERFRLIQDIWATRGFASAFRHILDGFDVEPRLLSFVDGERRVTNLLHLGDLLHSVAHAERYGPSALVRWLAATRASSNREIQGEAAELRLESDARAVKLLTIHKSKGLEYPIVYCPFLWDASPRIDESCLAFHDRSDHDRLKLHLAPDDAAKSAALLESRAELQRLLYVALTRAKHRCSIVWGAFNDTDESCLAYALHSGRQAVSKLSDVVLRKDLHALATASKGSVGIRELFEGKSPSYVDEERTTRALEARHYDRRVDGWWRYGSFSAMASGHTANVPELEGLDRDDLDAPQIAALALGASTPTDPQVALRTFPRGSKPGTLIHAILEECDFPGPTSALHDLTHRKLEAFGYSADEHGSALVGALGAMIATPLGVGLKLADLPHTRRANELEFLFPVAQRRGRCVTPKGLAGAFAKFKTDQVPSSYVTQLETLGFLPLRGFLRGFIDLVFEHEGRFFVVDYKSNHLGDVASAYAPHRLAHAMTHANYFLQYHLYSVAVHRWLSRRLRNYDYERCFGGVLYLFVRGMNPAHTQGTGIFFDRPRPEMIEELSELFHHG